MDKIFVSIAAYEDDLLINTITEAYEKAARPDNVILYIGLQYKNPPDLNNITDMQQINIITYDVETRPGVVKIRYQLSEAILNLSQIEHGDYFLMIDAHTKFAQNWDIDLINDLKYLQLLKNKKEIILSKQCSFWVGQIKEPYEESLCSMEIPIHSDIVGTLFKCQAKPVRFPKEKFQSSPWASCHFFFTTYEFLKDVGLDSLSETYQEEPYLSFRAYMSNYDIYNNLVYSYIGHDSYKQYDGYDPRYWIKLDDGGYRKIFSTKNDPDFCALTILAYINNTGVYSIKNTERTPKMFFEKFGAPDVYDSLINNVSLFNYLKRIEAKAKSNGEIDIDS